MLRSFDLDAESVGKDEQEGQLIVRIEANLL
jgi:hypothetical protein